MKSNSPVASLVVGIGLVWLFRCVHGLLHVDGVFLRQIFALPSRLWGRPPEQRASREPSIGTSFRRVKVKVCNDSAAIVAGLELLAGSKTLGLDVEWRPKDLILPGKQSGGEGQGRVSVLQLASHNVCLVIQLLRASGSAMLPNELSSILGASSILMVGVGIHGDVSKLLRDYGLVCKGCVDLRHLSIRESLVVRAQSLEALSAWAGLRLSKDPSVRLSDWSAWDLSPEQIRYACEDAFAGLAVLQHMLRMRTCAASDNPSGPFSVLEAPSQESQVLVEELLESDKVMNFCAEFVDLPFATRPASTSCDTGMDLRRWSKRLHSTSQFQCCGSVSSELLLFLITPLP